MLLDIYSLGNVYMTTESTARPSWRGNIEFAGIPIAVVLFNAAPDRDSPFVTVHGGTCGGRVKHDVVCKRCAATLGAEDTGRAVEVDGVGLVPVSDADLAGLIPPSSKVVKLVSFAPVGETSLIFHEKSYYARPAVALDRRGFDVLRAALTRSRKVAFGKISFRSSERIAMVAMDGGQLMVHCLRFPDELRAFLDPTTSMVTNDEVEKACEFMNLTAPHPLTLFRDDYTRGLQQLVSSRAGRKVFKAPDLLASLDAGVKAAKRSSRRRKAA